MCSMVFDKNYQIAIEQNIAMPCFDWHINSVVLCHFDT